MKFLILDGYTDEPAGLGVPPYIGTYPRYTAGVLYNYNYDVHYITIDRLREEIKKGFNFNKFDVVIAICGFHTPGKYLNANPATLREIVSILYDFKGLKILGGPVATKFGSSMEGGKIKDEEKLKYFFDVVASGDLEIVLSDLIENNFSIEKINPEKLRKLIAKGYVVIPKNIHRNTKPVGIGDNLRTKVNVNIGTSPDCVDIDMEIRKTKIANKYGADAIMDLSTGGDLPEIRKAIMENTDLPIGTVPMYEIGVESRKKYGRVIDMDEDIIFNVIERQAKEGVDFMTLHCGITKNSVESLKNDKRIMGVVSRGGAFLTAYIMHHNKENPLYEQFDYLLEILKEHDVTLSLGDGMRPGCLCDNTDRPQIHELIILGELVDRCREAGVQVMVEGPGHVPLNNVETNMRIQKSLCKNAPFYVLGPIVTDLAPGYDHITSAIGGALAAYCGANFLCYVTPAEHLRLMDENDVKEGLIASKIAAQAADVARGNPMAWEKEKEMAIARKNHDWEKQFELSIDKEKPRKMREELPSADEKACSVCGEFCALLMVEEAGKR